MQKILATLPNQLTAARLGLIPIMWGFTLMKMPGYVGAGIFISFVTDVLDGYMARKFNQDSELGSRFDSLADNVLLLSALVWMWLLRPEVYIDNRWVCLLAVALFISSLLAGIVKFQRFANLHLYSSKAAGVAMYLFLSLTFLMDHYNPVFFVFAAGMFIISSAETLLLQLTFSKVDEHMGSLLLALQSRKSLDG